MKLNKVLALTLLTTTASLYGPASLADSVTKKAEAMAEKPTGEVADLNIVTRTGKLSEEQAVNQLKFMTVQGWKRIEADLKERGSFKAFGLTLSPSGEFRPLFIDDQEEIPQQIQIDALVRNLKAIADTRSVWAVGLMYVTGNKNPDGSISKRIAVVSEHIAGWAKAWSYPYKVENGELKLGNSKEADMEPVYFSRP